MASQRSGLVIKSTGSWYTLKDTGSAELLECRLAGRVRLDARRSTNPIVVGDMVDYTLDDKQNAAIIRIHERHNYIIRRSPNLSKESHIIAANIDQAFLVATLNFPTTSYEFIDRFLLTAEVYRIPTTILLNKIDLYDTPDLVMMRQAFLNIYREAGYEVLEISAVQGLGIDRLRERLQGKVSLFSGNSGVGKSTLISLLEPGLELRTGEVSDANRRGKHTTTFSEMYPLSEGKGYIIDTPGIKGFGLIDIENDEIGRYMPDLFEFSSGCSYNNCTHTHEPDCAVKSAVEQGQISVSRYESYLKLLNGDDKYRK